MDLHARQHDDDDGGEKDEDDDLPDNRHQAFNATGLGMEGGEGDDKDTGVDYTRVHLHTTTGY